MQKGFRLLFILTCLSLISAKNEQARVFYAKLSGELVSFTLREKLLISSECLIKDKEKCLPQEKFKNLTLRSLLGSLTSGKNPGAIICQEQLKGEVVLLFDGNRNERTFCRIKPKLYLPNDQLTMLARENDNSWRRK